jgi:type I restriction enzyme R subunit
MTESVKDEITVRIVYEGRAAKVLLNNSKLKEIEDYYAKCAEIGSNENQIEQSKKEMAQMYAIIGDPDRLAAVAEDFVNHYDKRVSEGSTVKGKAMFVCSTREIAYDLYKNIIALKPEWNEIRAAEEGAVLTDKDKRELKPIERIKLIATRGQDDPKEMYDLLGTKEQRKELDRQFKNEKSNFKIAMVVDMWLTGFDIPSLDSIYIDKPIQRHSLIQTISRVNRKFEGKNKGLVIDYIGIKNQMNLALKQYSEGDKDNFEDIAESIIIVRNHLDLLAKLFHTFDNTKYFKGTAIQQLNTLNLAAEYVQKTKDFETRFMGLVKRLKAAYDICSGSEQITQLERDYTHFYLAVRSIVFKLTRGNAPDTAQMNAKVREMIKDALQSDGVEEIFKLGDETQTEQDIFDEDYLAKIDKIKLPNTKIKLLQQLLAKVIAEIRKVNRVKGIDFTKKMQALVERYNDRDANDILRSEVYEEMANALTDLIWEVHKEFNAGDELGIDFEEKAFYDILKELCVKYDFKYPEDKMIDLAKAVKELVDGQARFPDWNKRDDIKSALKVGLILLLDEFGYPPVERDEVYVEIFEQAENFKKNQAI